jgi:hypothetical protein
VIALSCNRPKPTIYPLEQLTDTVDVRKYGKVLFDYKKNEYYVIEAPPKPKGQLWEVVWNDVLSTWRLSDTIFPQHFKRFYKKTSYTPVDYVENERDYFNIDRIEHHSEDLLMRIEWRNGKPYECLFFEHGAVTLISEFCDSIPCELSD